MNDPRRRMIFQTDQTRSLILDTAWQLFIDRGFFDTQMKDIAEATSLSRTSLYRYYRDKTDLAIALARRVFENVFESEPEGLDVDGKGNPVTGLQAIEIYLRERWLSPQLREQFVFLAEFDAYFSGSRVPADFRETMRDMARVDKDSFLESLIRRGIEDTSVRPDIDPHLAGVTLLNAVRGTQQRLLLRGGVLVELRAGDLERIPDELLRYLISGLRNTVGVDDEAGH